MYLKFTMRCHQPFIFLDHICIQMLWIVFNVTFFSHILCKVEKAQARLDRRRVKVSKVAERSVLSLMTYLGNRIAIIIWKCIVSII